MKKKIAMLTLGICSVLFLTPNTVFAGEKLEYPIHADTNAALNQNQQEEKQEPSEANANGYIISDCDLNVATSNASDNILHAASLPDKYDPFATGQTYLPAVRDQNPYGTCWAFSTTGLEEMSAVKQGIVATPPDLSELHLAYFTYHSIVDPLQNTAGDSTTFDNSYENFMNMGGNYDKAITSLMLWRGAVNESDVPYSMAEQAIDQGLDAKYAYQYDSFHVKDGYVINIKTNQDAVKQAILDNGAVGISYYESSRNYNKTYNSYFNSRSMNGNHAVSIVGWDDSFAASHFNRTAKEDGAWLIRNSWGSNGYNHYGYFWMSYSDASISKAAYVIKEDRGSDYTHNYEYDGAMSTDGWGGVSNIEAANVYTVSSTDAYETLKAVAFSTSYSSDYRYEIKVYKNPSDASNPESGTYLPEATTDGFFKFTGSYTIPLKNPVTFQHGDKMAIVVSLSNTSGNPIYIDSEKSDTYGDATTIASAKGNESYLKIGAGSWSDFGLNKDENLRIKAFTDADTNY